MTKIPTLYQLNKQSLIDNDNAKFNKISRFSALQVIEDVTESKELSQRGYDTFKSKDAKIFRIKSQDKLNDYSK